MYISVDEVRAIQKEIIVVSEKKHTYTHKTTKRAERGSNDQRFELAKIAHNQPMKSIGQRTQSDRNIKSDNSIAFVDDFSLFLCPCKQNHSISFYVTVFFLFHIFLCC